MSSYVYVRSEPSLWTVGFYDPKGEWHRDSDFSSREDARRRVHYLNGGGDPAVLGAAVLLQRGVADLVQELGLGTKEKPLGQPFLAILASAARLEAILANTEASR